MNELKRYRGKYLKPDKEPKKTKHAKGMELQHICLCTYSHSGKMPNHGGAI
jgi:hypothetical protein